MRSPEFTIADTYELGHKAVVAMFDENLSGKHEAYSHVTGRAVKAEIFAITRRNGRHAEEATP